MMELLGMTLGTVDLIAAGIALAAVFALVFALYLLLEGDADEAARKTRRRAKGVIGGALTVIAFAVAELLHILAEVPGLVIAAIGVGAILQGWNWDVFLAVVVLVWIGLEAVERLTMVRRA